MKEIRAPAILVASWLTVLLASMGAAPAYAVDTKIYPGSMCVRWSGSTSYGLNSSSIGNFSSTEDLFVDCPGVHDASTISSGWVRVTDQNLSVDLSCTLASTIRLTTNSQKYHLLHGPESSVGTSPNVQQLNFGGVGASSLSHYYYSCKIPRTYEGVVSYLHTYQIVERD